MVTFGYATSTGLSALLDGTVSYDSITRFLSKQDYTSKEVWAQVKPLVREVETTDGVLILDDTVQERPYMDENELICWHYDHCVGRNVKGINLLNVSTMWQMCRLLWPLSWCANLSPIVIWRREPRSDAAKSARTNRCAT